MISREEIFEVMHRRIHKDVDKSTVTPEFVIQTAILETLLDVRDLLTELNDNIGKLGMRPVSTGIPNKNYPTWGNK